MYTQNATLKKLHSTPEVAVVGGSAAGFLAASLLAKGGARVRVMERSENLEPAERTLIVTSRLRDLLGPVGESCIVNEIRRFELFTDGRAAKISLNRPDLIIERASLIRSLAAQAQEAGAEVRLGRRFVGLTANDGGISVNLERSADGRQEEVPADSVIGADGALSSVALAAGWPRLETVPLIQAIVQPPADYPADTVRVWFIPEDTPYFYWMIPESPTRAALGLIGEDGPETRLCLERFMEKRCFTPLAFQGARIPVYRRWVPVERRFGRGRVYLVGDAAAQVKVTTVGGIVTGFRGALGVAESILNNGRSRELSALRRELDLHLLIRKTIHNFQQADYSHLVDLLNESTRASLSEHNRDEAARVLWHICRKQPRLLLLGLRGLLTKGFLPRRGRD
jgi:flavin-dependent dehydrogenase